MTRDWAAVTRLAWPVAARVLGWSPDLFWRSTPSELLGALDDPSTNAAPLGRNDLSRMMEADDG